MSALLTKAQVLKVMKKWRKRLHLEDWTIGLEFATDNDAACSAQPEYRLATVYINPEVITKDDIEEIVCHELLHCYVEALSTVAETLAKKDSAKLEWVRREEENLTNRLTDILVGAYAKPKRK